MTKQYDHRTKAGNQGDVGKHVALLASLDVLLAQFRGQQFRYADIYAGFPCTKLRAKGEWTRGIGRIHKNAEINGNPHTKLYSEWYLSHPKLAGTNYPGSGSIAMNVAKRHNVELFLELWDTNVEAADSLRLVLGNLKTNIHHRAASPREESAVGSDYLLIDPPGVNAKSWLTIFDFLVHAKGSVLLWLAVNANTSSSPPKPSILSTSCLKDAQGIGYSALSVKWGQMGSNTIGCCLIYKMPIDAQEALEQAVCRAVKLAGFQAHLCLP